jgi:dTDP-4-dehydrorhamnose reductase
MMRILITGAQGQIGRALAANLQDSATLAAFARQELDISDLSSVRRAFDQVRPDLVLNAAAWTAVDKAESDPAGSALANAVGPGILAAECERTGAGIIHFSTDYVFDGSGTRPWRETDTPRPLNRYGRSKLAGELAVGSAASAHLIVRTSWIYDGQGKNFLKTMLSLMAERPELRVVNDQFGAPTSAGAVADAVKRIVRNMKGKPRKYLEAHGGVVHCACRGVTSWHGFARAIRAAAVKRGFLVKTKVLHPIPSAEYPLPAPRPANSRLSLARLEREFKVPMPHWKIALEEALDAMASSPGPR